MISVLFSDSGKSVRKSMARCDQGLCGFSSGSNFPAGKCHGTLAWVQVKQDATYPFISLAMVGHQYLVPGCPDAGDV